MYIQLEMTLKTEKLKLFKGDCDYFTRLTFHCVRCAYFNGHYLMSKSDHRSLFYGDHYSAFGKLFE